ncbi:RecA RecA/RadA recombinase [uncultured Caudovirales phage]|uniref:RecA RecA/RadA recombinase n=1 Tax=uncultured Caudovirales phage TaxID=2100421 RepID=A0A6J5S5D4_9CAUD|nr:RecA RecA/RadA recombinase [uncultured Caudovirales phage]
MAVGKGAGLASLRSKVNAAYGGKVAQAAHQQKFAHPRLSTGSLPLDHAVGVEPDGSAGVPTGLITMFVGGKSSGKTTTALRVLAAAQRCCARCWRPAKNVTMVPEMEEDKDGALQPALDDQGEVVYTLTGQCDCYAIHAWEPVHPKEYPDNFDTKKAAALYDEVLAHLKLNSYEPVGAAYFDVENALDRAWAKRFGVMLEVLEIIVPGSGEEGIDVCTEYIKSGLIDFYVMDSLAQLTPRVEIEASSEDQQRAAQAKLINKAVRVWVSTSAHVQSHFHKSVTAIWIQQERMGMGQGAGKVKPGGKGQEFAEAIEVEFFKSDVEEVPDPAYKGLNKSDIPMRSSRCRVNYVIKKNKTFPTEKMKGSFRVAMMDGDGIQAGDILEEEVVNKLALALGIVEKNGSKYTYEGKSYSTQSEVFDEVFGTPEAAARNRVEILKRIAGFKVA